jgi:hypothetical protein
MPSTTASVTVTEILAHPSAPAKTVSGAVLSQQPYFATVQGSAADETFDAADLSARTQALMAAHKRGVTVAMGGGNDTVIGSAYGDTIAAGAGINYVDGGANQGSAPGGAAALDILDVYVADAAAAAAVAVVSLDAQSSGADNAAFTGGYKFKVTSGAGETTYVKNVEQVSVRLESDRSTVKAFSLVIQVQETTLPADQLATQTHFAMAIGSDLGDIFNAATDISSATLAKMDAFGRGVYVDTGAGDDTIKGSAYGDHFDAGAGVNHVDGGANGGLTPSGTRSLDVLVAHAASKGDFDAATVIQLGSASAGADLAAFNNGYMFKLVNGTTEVDYFRNIEQVQIDYWTDANANGLRDLGEYGFRSVNMAVEISEEREDPANPGYLVSGRKIEPGVTVANVTGTAFGETFVAATDLSAAALGLMAITNSGISANMGAGDDTIVGTDYQDNINAGPGVNHIDGGAQGFVDGGTPRDTLTVTSLSQANFDAFSVTELSSASTGADLTAFDSGYTYKVTSGAAETDYLKNVESVFTQFWNDLNGNGRRDSGETRSKLVSLTLGIFEERLDPANPGYLIDGGPIAEASKLAYVTGTPFADTFDVGINLSATGRALMDSAQVGMTIDTGAGNDIIKTSAYADQIVAGTGVNHIDGGAGVDTLDVYVTSQAAALALAVQTLGAASTGADAAAFAAGYLYKLDAGAEVDYLINIEQVRVYLWNDKNGDGRVTHAAPGSAANEATLAITLVGNPDPAQG